MRGPLVDGAEDPSCGKSRVSEGPSATRPSACDNDGNRARSADSTLDSGADGVLANVVMGSN